MLHIKSLKTPIIFAFVFAVLSSLSAPAFANKVSDRELATLAKAVQRCISVFPDMSKVTAAHRRARMKYEGRTSDYEIFTAQGRSVLILNARRDDRAQCLFGVDGLLEDNADIVLKGLVSALNGKMGDELPQENLRGMWKAWPAQIGDQIVIIGVTRIQRFGNLYRGSLILVERVQKQ